MDSSARRIRTKPDEQTRLLLVFQWTYAAKPRRTRDEYMMADAELSSCFVWMCVRDDDSTVGTTEV